MIIMISDATQITERSNGGRKNWSKKYEIQRRQRKGNGEKNKTAREHLQNKNEEISRPAVLEKGGIRK